MRCSELVRLVTDYLEGALPAPERLRFDEHLAACGDCTAHLDQMRTTISVVGQLREADIPQAARDALLRAFRDWRTQST